MFKIDLDFKIRGQTLQTISPDTFKSAEGHSAEMLMDELQRMQKREGWKYCLEGNQQISPQ